MFIELQTDYDEPSEFLEKYLHSYFKPKRVYGEWFNLTLKDICEIREFIWEIEGEWIVDEIDNFFSKKRRGTEHYKELIFQNYEHVEYA